MSEWMRRRMQEQGTTSSGTPGGAPLPGPAGPLLGENEHTGSFSELSQPPEGKAFGAEFPRGGGVDAGGNGPGAREVEDRSLREDAAGNAVRKRPWEERIAEALTELNRYKAGKASLEQRVIEAERYFRQHNWTSKQEIRDAIQQRVAV